MTSSTPLLRVTGLTTTVGTGPAALPAVRDVSFTVNRGEILGIVGESGSGKTLTALSVVRMLPAGVHLASGEVLFDETNLQTCSEAEMRSIRGRRIGMIFQDPLAYLNPRMTIGDQIAECCIVHGTSPAKARTRTIELLDLVGIEDAERRLGDYPHQFSGGMRQRVLIAMAMANDPELLIADEPTTALDVTVQAEILQLLVKMRDERGVAVMIITHDMSIVRQICDTTMVMYGGRIAERGSSHGAADDPGVLHAPRHPYTQALMNAVPQLDSTHQGRLETIPGTPPDLREMPLGCPFAPRCARRTDECEVAPPPLELLTPARQVSCLHPIGTREAIRAIERTEDRVLSPVVDEPVLVVDDITLRYPGTTGRKHRDLRPALSNVSISVAPRQLIGIIGESGSGKSTLARAMLGLVSPQLGSVTVNGQSWSTAKGKTRAKMRQTVQMVFQDPYLSLNPRLSIRQILAEPLTVHKRGDAGDQDQRLRELMDTVGLPLALLDRLAHQLSGGQRQRVGIARALAVEPSIVVADEPVSALDVSVQAQIVNLLSDLRENLGLGIAFIAHDLGLVRQCTDETVVMHRGQIVERGPSAELFANPQHPYTQHLIASGQELAPAS